MGFELAVLHHALDDAGVEELGFLDHALYHLLRGGLHFLLDETYHRHIALDLNVLAQIEAVWWRTESKLPWLHWFARLVPAYLPFVAQVDPGRRIRVRL